MTGMWRHTWADTGKAGNRDGPGKLRARCVPRVRFTSAQTAPQERGSWPPHAGRSCQLPEGCNASARGRGADNTEGTG